MNHMPLRFRIWTLGFVALAVASCSDGPTAVPPEGAIDLAAPWVVTSPDLVGLDGNALFVAGELAERIERMRSLLVIRGGRLAYERYYGGWTADTLADVRSVTKSVVSTLVGIAIGQGHINGLNQPITDFLRSPEFAVDLDHAFINIGHLLTMTSGLSWAEGGVDEYNDWVISDDHVDYVLSRPFDAQPGQAFVYNSAAVHLLGVVLEKATGMSLPQYADQVLFGPLGIGEREWESLTGGYVNGGSGLDLRPRDLARFGQLFLQEGWSGQESILPGRWVAEATTRRIIGLGGSGPFDDLSYGYLWWLDGDQGAYLAWGFAGQFVYVVPRLDLVVVATTEWRGVRDDIGNERLQEEVLNIIVERILPAAR